jgi:hypothetical protein
MNRKTTSFTGGEIRITSGMRRGTHDVGQQPVRIMRAIPENGNEDEDDRFEVEFHNLGSAIVDGFDLHPHPEAPKTNVEAITDIMESGSPLRQMFVVDAIGKLADAVVADAETFKADTNGIIYGPAWLKVAEEIKAELDAKYGSAKQSAAAACETVD